MRAGLIIFLIALILATGAMGRYGQNPEVVFNFFKALFWWLIGFWVITSGIAYYLKKINLLKNAFGCFVLTVLAQGITYIVAS